MSSCYTTKQLMNHCSGVSFLFCLLVKDLYDICKHIKLALIEYISDCGLFPNFCYLKIKQMDEYLLIEEVFTFE